MRAGKLRHQIIIQQSTETRGTGGGFVSSWTTFATRWASVEPLKGREFFGSAELNTEVTHRIGLRYVAGVTAKMRVLWGVRVFRIVVPLNIAERNIELELMCVEVV